MYIVGGPHMVYLGFEFVIWTISSYFRLSIAFSILLSEMGMWDYRPFMKLSMAMDMSAMSITRSS
jgi:hypothetical protein